MQATGHALTACSPLHLLACGGIHKQLAITTFPGTSLLLMIDNGVAMRQRLSVPGSSPIYESILTVDIKQQSDHSGVLLEHHMLHASDYKAWLDKLMLSDLP